MNIVTIFVMVLVFLGGICILAGYMLTNAMHKLRVTISKKRKGGETPA